MAKMGRPTKFNDERAAKILEALRLGVPQTTAVSYAGVHDATYYRWLQEATKPDAPQELRDFRDAVKAARAEAEVRSVAVIQNASRKTWQAAAWFLERGFPQHWARSDRHEITGRDGGPIELNVDADALESKVRQLIAKRRGDDASGPVVE